MTRQDDRGGGSAHPEGRRYQGSSGQDRGSIGNLATAKGGEELTRPLLAVIDFGQNHLDFIMIIIMAIMMMMIIITITIMTMIIMKIVIVSYLGLGMGRAPPYT